MSLHKFAEQVAAQGRGDDSLLVHMTPDEVQRLQAFAEANGRTMTINPDTGLPEAGFLSDLFKAVAPIALGAFLGPAGVALGGPGLTAGMAGLATGGITALATGSLSRGLMAGLGAYGGAGIGESLMNAGTGALSSAAGAGLVGDEAIQQAVGAKLASATPMETLTAGFNSATASPAAMGTFAKNNLKYLGAAASPIMAGQMVPTTTTMPENTNPAYIRQKLYDPYTQTYKSLAPVKAADWGSRNFSDAYTNPQTGEMATLQPRTPSGMAGGGIVALAIGGDTKTALEQAYAANDVAKMNELIAQNKITAGDIGDTYKGFDTSGIAGLQPYTPPAAPTYNQFTNEQIGSYLTANPNADIQKAITDTNADPAAVNKYIASLASGFKGSTDTAGGSGTLGIYKDMIAKGIDPSEYYAAAKANDPKYGGWDQAMVQKGYNLDKGAYALTDQIAKDKIAADPKLGYDKQWVKFMDDNKYSIDDMAQAFGISKNEVKRRYDAAKAAMTVAPPVTPVTPVTPVINNTFGSSTAVDRRITNPYGNAINPGDKTFNTDGSVTVTPNIPYRPYGGFPGMASVRDAYTAGGGSLGYTSPVPKSTADFEQMYNKQTGDSLAAYNYLMGKGANPIQSGAASTGIMRPYFSEGMRYKPKFLTSNTDGTIQSSTTKSGTTGTTAPPAQSINVKGPSGGVLTAFLGADGTYRTVDGAVYDANGEPVTVTQSFADGGGLGSLGSYSDGGRLLKGPGDGVSDSIPATIGTKNQPARLADGEFVIPARIVSELGNGSTDAGAKKLYAMMDRVQKARGKTTGKNKVAANSRSDKYLPA